MSHRQRNSSTATALLLVTLVAAGCADDGPASEEDAVRSATSAEMSSSSPSSSRSTSPPPPRSPAGSAATTSPTSPPTPPAASPPFVASATWDDSKYGATLRIAPTPSARRAGGIDDAATAWSEVLALAPDADSPGMWEQFDCHWTWARILEPNKATWNIEPWRPVVPVESMLLEGCNPGGPEV